MTKLKLSSGPALIILSGIFWGSMGIFVRSLETYGFNSIQIVSLRLTVAALAFGLILLCRDRQGFKLHWKDLPLFLGLGLMSVLFFTVCYFTAISMMPLSTAAILLYTSPIWVMLMSLIFFKEKLSGRKLLALGLAFSGCVLVSGLSRGGLSIQGLAIGLGSGIGYGLYSILGSIALKRYSAYTLTTYTFAVASVGSWFVCGMKEMLGCFISAPSIPLLLGLVLLCGLISAVIPYLCYTLGLKTVEASKAAILATVEPMVATLFGIFIFGEELSLSSGLGIGLILSAIILLNKKAVDKKT